MKWRSLPLLGLLLGLACGDEPQPSHLVLDLREALPFAEATVFAACIEPAESRSRLVEGWSSTETDRDRNERFVWSVGDSSSFEIDVAERIDTVLRLRGRAFVYPGVERQEVTVRLGDHEVGAVEFGASLEERSLPVDGAFLEAGRNRVELSYSHPSTPRAALGADDDRPLAMAWVRFCLGDGSPASEPPRVNEDLEALFLPFGSQLDYFFEPLPSARWVAASLQLRGEGELSLELASDEAGSSRLGSWSLAARDLDVELGSSSSGPVRLRLRARAAAGSQAGGGVLLQDPLVLADSAAEPLATPEPAKGRGGTGHPLILYLVDTLRADQVGVYGRDSSPTPRIDAFARDGIVFEKVLAQSAWTRAAVASLFTGLRPTEHGTNGRRDRLPDTALTLAEILRQEGFETAAFFTNPNLDRRFGFEQGFETFVREDESSRSSDLNPKVMRWLGERESDRPLFLYVHTQDPHDPYDPPPDERATWAGDVPSTFPTVPGRRQEVTDDLVEGFRRLYEGEVAANDASFGDFLDGLREHDLYDEAFVLLLSDHGEEFQEHGGWKHGRTLHGEMVSVPAILKLPGSERAGERFTTRVQHVDLLPTLLAGLGLEPPSALPGRDVLRLPAEGMERETLYAYLHLDGAPQISVVHGAWKLILMIPGDRAPQPRLYDLRRDPGELENLAEELPVLAGYLTTLARRHLGEARPLGVEEAEIDAELEESLRALGYL